MKKGFKKILSVFLCVIMLFSLSAAAFAADDVTPVIVVSGMGAFPLVDENGESVWPVSSDKMIKNISQMILPTIGSALLNDWTIFNSFAMSPLYDIFEPISCDENGDSVHAVTAQIFPGSAASYKEEFEQRESSEIAVVRGVADEIGWDNTYYFYYDWRKNPLDIADELNETVKQAMAECGSDKVSLFAMSFGGMVTSSYIYKYGTDNIKNIVYGSTAFEGVEMLGKLFSNQIDINISEAIVYLSSMVKENAVAASVLGLSSDMFSKYGTSGEKAVDAYLAMVVSTISDPLYKEVFAQTFAHFKGMWCLMPGEYYESAKEYMSTTSTISESFFASTDEYFYNVQAKNEELIENAQANGTNVYIIGAYGYAEIPVTKGEANQTDMLIDTYLMTGGCTVAPYGKTLSDVTYEKGTTCTAHNHASTDGIVDASTAMLPEQTWVIKDMTHVEFNYAHESNDLAVWLVTSDERVNVYSNEKYPQFVQIDRETGKFVSLTEGVTLSSPSTKMVFSGILDMIMALVKKILSYVIK